MKKLSFLLMMFGLISFSLISCSDDDDAGGNVFTGPNCYNAWITAYSQSTQQMSSAAQAYGTDPTEENCNAFKAAYQSFLDDIKPFQNCAAITGQEREEFIEQIQEAEEDIDDLC